MNGSGMVSRDEVALILTATGLQETLLLPDYFTSIFIVIIVTTLVTPPLLMYFIVLESKSSSRNI